MNRAQQIIAIVTDAAHADRLAQEYAHCIDEGDGFNDYTFADGSRIRTTLNSASVLYPELQGAQAPQSDASGPDPASTPGS